MHVWIAVDLVFKQLCKRARGGFLSFHFFGLTPMKQGKGGCGENNFHGVELF